MNNNPLVNGRLRCGHRTRGRDGYAYQCVKRAGHWWLLHLSVMGDRWFSRQSYNRKGGR